MGCWMTKIVLDKYFGINTQDPYEPSSIIYGDKGSSDNHENSLSKLLKETFSLVDGYKGEVSTRLRITIGEIV